MENIHIIDYVETIDIDGSHVDVYKGKMKNGNPIEVKIVNDSMVGLLLLVNNIHSIDVICKKISFKD